MTADWEKKEIVIGICYEADKSVIMNAFCFQKRPMKANGELDLNRLYWMKRPFLKFSIVSSDVAQSLKRVEKRDKLYRWLAFIIAKCQIDEDCMLIKCCGICF